MRNPTISQRKIFLMQPDNMIIVEAKIKLRRTIHDHFVDLLLYLVGTMILTSSPSSSFVLSHNFSSLLSIKRDVRVLTASFLFSFESWIALGASGLVGTTPLPREFSLMRNRVNLLDPQCQ